MIGRADLFHRTTAILSFIAVAGFAAQATGQDLPDYWKGLVGTQSTAPEATATANILALNVSMFDLYDSAGQIFTKNILASQPVILALFSGSGGTFTLYRPGQPPLQAPSVPMVYQILKSVGHSTMALAEVVGPYLTSPEDQSWRSPILAFRSRMQSALDGLDTVSMPADWRENSRTILKRNLDFIDACLAERAISAAMLEKFGRQQAPFLAKNVAWAAQTQVAHWMDVVGKWKSMLGPDWEKTVAASNTIYVARQNNVLFSVLAQYFGPEAINDRLLLIETISFTTTQADMLSALTRIIADRSVGQLFFGNYHLMDYELMGGDARDAIVAETAKRNMKPFLPPAVPFGSHQWPTLVTPGPGPTSIATLH
jgi:hypothetical protein